MKIALLKEQLPGEARVALMPDSVKKLLGLGATVFFGILKLKQMQTDYTLRSPHKEEK